jgi:hypothetical protein
VDDDFRQGGRVCRRPSGYEDLGQTEAWEDGLV